MKKLSNFDYFVFIAAIILSIIYFEEAGSFTSMSFASIVGLLLYFHHRVKHIDDSNLTRKKDAILDYIGAVGDYCTSIVKISDSEALLESTKKLNSTLAKLYVVISDEQAAKVEEKNSQLISSMLKIRTDYESYIKKFESPNSYEVSNVFQVERDVILDSIQAGIITNLNNIKIELVEILRYEIIECGDLPKLKQAIETSNKKFTKELSNK